MIEKDQTKVKWETRDRIFILYLVYISFVFSIYEYIPSLNIFNFFVHLLPLFLFVFSKNNNLNLFCIPVGIIVLGFLSYGFSNDLSFYSFFNSFRWSCLSLFVYLWAASQQWNENKLRKWIVFVFIIAVLQIAVGFLKFLLFSKYGELGYEMPLGLLGHSVTTVVTSTAWCFVLSYYMEDRIYPHIVYILLAVGFFFCGIVGGKRALVVLFPIVVSFQLFLFYYFTKQKAMLLRFLLVAAILLPSVIYVFTRITPTLNPEREVWGSFDFDYLYEYIEFHVSYDQQNQYGDAIGRSSALDVYITQQFSDWKTVLLGKGVGFFARSAQDNSAAESLGIDYGINAYIWTSYQWGIIGAILWFFMFFYPFFNAIYVFKKEKDRFWRAYSLSMMGAAWLAGPFQFYYGCDLKHIGYSSIYYFLSAILQQKALSIKANSNSTESVTI